MLDVNTVSRYPTHFLRAVELIIKARDTFNVCSENWPSPTKYNFGIPNDQYYAEIWVDGMDWQPSFWIIEEHSLQKPEINPLIIFDSNENRSLFNDRDFEDLINAICWYRRDLLWVKHSDLSYYTDSVWPFLFHKNKNPNKYEPNYYFEHASQPKVNFWLNFDFVPKDYRYRFYSKEARSKIRGYNKVTIPLKEVNKR